MGRCGLRPCERAQRKGHVKGPMRKNHVKGSNERAMREGPSRPHEAREKRHFILSYCNHMIFLNTFFNGKNSRRNTFLMGKYLGRTHFKHKFSKKRDRKRWKNRRNKNIGKKIKTTTKKRIKTQVRATFWQSGVFAHALVCSFFSSNYLWL